MIYRFFLWFGLILTSLLSGVAASDDIGAEPVQYTLAPELSNGKITALKVQVRFQANASGTTEFGWADEWAAQDKLWQWARDFDITGAKAVEKVGAGHWRIQATPNTYLTATYKIISAYDHDPTVENSDQSKPVIRSRWFYAVGEALFGYPDNRMDMPATFDWSGAEGIGFASDLEHLAGQNRNALRPGVVGDVLESVVIGGHDLRIFQTDDESGVRLAIIGNYSFMPEQLDELTRRVIGVEREFWGTDYGAPFLATVAPIVGGPVASSFSGTGRSDGFALWVDQLVPLDQMKWFLAHEYFHSWNPARLGSLSEKWMSAEYYWFSEGFTDYYARALMVRAGLISPTEFAALWNEELAAYAGSSARNMPGAKAAAAFWNDDAAGRLPYQRGAMLAAIWNARLLDMSKGASNLDTVLQAQFAAAQSSRKEVLQLFRSIARQRGLDITADENYYLATGKTIRLPADTFGPCATVVTEQRPVFSRGFDAGATARAGNVVAGVDPAHPAYEAGLRDGMKILALEGEPDNSLVPYTLQVDDRGQQRTIRYLPQGPEQALIQQVRIKDTKDTAVLKCNRTLGGLP